MAENSANRKYVNLHDLGVLVEQSANLMASYGERLQSASRMADKELRARTLQGILREATRTKNLIDRAMFDLDIGLPEDML